MNLSITGVKSHLKGCSRLVKSRIFCTTSIFPNRRKLFLLLQTSCYHWSTCPFLLSQYI